MGPLVLMWISFSKKTNKQTNKNKTKTETETNNKNNTLCFAVLAIIKNVCYNMMVKSRKNINKKKNT